MAVHPWLLAQRSVCELRHWTQGRAGARLAIRDVAAGLENVAGSYDIGDGVSVDLTDSGPSQSVCRSTTT
jgi:hypothetical protein